MRFLWIICIGLSLFKLGAQTSSNENAEQFFVLFEKEVKRQKPDFVKAYKLLATAYYLDSSNLKYINNLSDLLHFVGEYDEALNVANRSIVVNEKQWQPYNLKGIIYKQRKQYKQAIEQFTLALEKVKEDSFRVGLLVNRSSAKNKIRDFESSLEDLKQAYAMDSANKSVFLGLGNGYGDLGSIDSAMIYYNKAVALDSTYVLGWLNIGFNLQEKEMYEKSLTYFDKALSLEPKNALALSNRSFSRFKTGDYDGAISDINASIALYPQNSWAYKNRAIYYLSRNKNKEACTDLNRAVKEGYDISYGDEVQKLLNEHCK